MKKLYSMMLVVALCLSLVACGAGQTAGGADADFTVGICQLMEHESLDKATEGFKAALTAALEAEGKTVAFDEQVAGGSDLCSTVVNTFTAKNVDLIMANATPALLADGNRTTTIPVLSTSGTEDEGTFYGSIPANVAGTCGAVRGDGQGQMMMDTLGRVAGDQVGVL